MAEVHMRIILTDVINLFGYYESTVENLKFDYSRPQENSCRTENRWLRMVNLDGKGLKSNPLFSLEPFQCK